MALYFTSLNSGSNGNCYYVGTKNDAVLIDVGISCRETEKRMRQLGLNMNTVKAIFVSHEHGDHVKGVSTLANKYSLPVYITAKTAKHGPRLISHLAKNFAAKETVTIGDLQVTPFLKCHDATDPHSFIINSNGITVGVLTDIGTVCDEVVHYFKQCHAVFLESNYDEAMLENGRYPIHLKNRIRGGHGHLSNREALDLFMKHRSPNLSHVLLSHLSKENNSPEIVESLFKQHANGITIAIAHRHQATEIFTISVGTGNPAIKKVVRPLQLGLFE
ncbi:MAG: MBL fold metallo-hydrolase [Chitinophagaceae bacterium]|nr:MBL fold metallo-hydrolase [Chitinophagaceae bacterium]